MAYDEELAGRIRQLIGNDPELSEKKMFGGLAFLIRGNMAIAASSEGGVMVRVDPGAAAAIGNAVFTATGRRFRTLPITPRDLVTPRARESCPPRQVPRNRRHPVISRGPVVMASSDEVRTRRKHPVRYR
jgi:hypothetical protein